MQIFISSKKLCFTLFEILTVMLILTLGLSVTGVKVYDMYTQQCYLSEVQQVVSKLQTAQDLMLILDTDVTLAFVNDTQKKGVRCFLNVQKPLTKQWTNLVEKPLLLKYIKRIEWNGQSFYPLKIHLSLGSMSQGELSFKKDAKEKFKDTKMVVNLKGYPSPILLNQTPTINEKLSFKNENLYPVDIYEQLHKNHEASTQ